MRTKVIQTLSRGLHPEGGKFLSKKWTGNNLPFNWIIMKISNWLTTSELTPKWTWFKKSHQNQTRSSTSPKFQCLKIQVFSDLKWLKITPINKRTFQSKTNQGSPLTGGFTRRFSRSCRCQSPQKQTPTNQNLTIWSEFTNFQNPPILQFWLCKLLNKIFLWRNICHLNRCQFSK